MQALAKASMSLALRLLIAFGLLAITATAAVGFGVREAWRTTEEQGFRERLDSATRGVESDIAWEVKSIRDLLRPVCEYATFVDQTLLDLERGSLESGRRLALTQLVPEEMKALSLDELVLVTGQGEVLGAGTIPPPPAPSIAASFAKSCTSRASACANRPGRVIPARSSRVARKSVAPTPWASSARGTSGPSWKGSAVPTTWSSPSVCR